MLDRLQFFPRYLYLCLVLGREGIKSKQIVDRPLCLAETAFCRAWVAPFLYTTSLHADSSTRRTEHSYNKYAVVCSLSIRTGVLVADRYVL